MKTFKPYSLTVKRHFPTLLVYGCVEPGEVIIRQGDVGNYFYFVVSGSVMVEVESHDASSGQLISNFHCDTGGVFKSKHCCTHFLLCENLDLGNSKYL